MNLLLDTHIWLWSGVQRRHLKASVAHEMEADSNERFLSPVSIWELGVLLQKKRLSLPVTLAEWLSRSQAQLILQEAPLTWDVGMEERAMGWSHKDPADRFLAATARVYGLTLVTSDERLASAPGIKVMWNG